MIQEEQWQEAAELLEGSEEIIAACHVNPDGDALGSMFGLASFLERQGKKVWRSWGSKPAQVPPQYTFIPGAPELAQPDDVPLEVPTFVSIDCADRVRTGNGYPSPGTQSIHLRARRLRHQATRHRPGKRHRDSQP